MASKRRATSQAITANFLSRGCIFLSKGEACDVTHFFQMYLRSVYFRVQQSVSRSDYSCAKQYNKMMVPDDNVRIVWDVELISQSRWGKWSSLRIREGKMCRTVRLCWCRGAKSLNNSEYLSARWCSLCTILEGLFIETLFIVFI